MMADDQFAGKGCISEYKEFLSGGIAARRFVALDPSSFAAVYAGRTGGSPTVEDNINFHRAFPSDAIASDFLNWEEILPELHWSRKVIRRDEDGTEYREETIRLPSGEKRRVIADKAGTTPWLVEAAVKSGDDFDLIEYYADCIIEGMDEIRKRLTQYPAVMKANDMLAGLTVLTAFETFYLIDYPDMPLFYMDCTDAYGRAIRNVHEANLLVLQAAAEAGYEIFGAGSAGLELLSPRIFREAIVPYQREFNDTARSLGCHTTYHICGHSRRLIEEGIIDIIRPTVFETLSAPPCGNNVDLASSVMMISEDIITKGNLSLELLRNGTPEEITDAVSTIMEAVGDRRHIIGQADATILDGTPHENIRAFTNAVKR